jgi:hypothetical protein
MFRSNNNMPLFCSTAAQQPRYYRHGEEARSMENKLEKFYLADLY